MCILLVMRKELRMEKIYKFLLGKKVLSLDIFDTLIFRCVKKPSDLFEEIALVARQRGYLDNYWSDSDFKHARIEAERLLYKDNKEPIFEEIYDNLRIKKSNIIKIQELEIALEVENCFVNHNMLKLMEYAVNQGIKVVLVSDMYLRKEHIMRMLDKCEVPMDWINDIFVSSEFQVSKRNGLLYNIVLDKYSITPGEMLHIGDNYQSDVVMAKEKGIDAYHYCVLENIDNSLFMDNIMLNDFSKELYSVRNLISSCVDEADSDKKKWVQFGLDNLGPFFTYGIEWALDVLEQENIDTIYPLMREGELYQDMLEEAIKYRDKKINISLFYSSRNSMFLNQFDTVQKEVIENVYKKACKEEVSVYGLFELFHVEEHFPETLLDIRNNFLNSLENMDKNNILQCMCSEEMLEYIQRQVEIAQRNTKLYLNKMGMNDKRFATLDFGYKATTQTFIEGILKKDKPDREDNLHLLLLQSKNAIENICKGVDIRGYVSTSEFEGTAYASGCRDGILEALQMRGSGCTMEYDGDGNPVLLDVQGISDEQFEHVRWIHEGVLLYQKLFLKYYYKNERMRQVKYKPNILYQQLCRCVLFPTKEEADMLSSLYHEDTFGNMLITKIMSYKECENKDWQSLNNLRYDGYYRPWHPGLFVQKNPLYFVEKETALLEEKGVAILAKAVVQAFEDGVKKVVVAGSGQTGERVFQYCSLMGIDVSYFTDANRRLHGTKKFSVPISGIAQLSEQCDFIIASIPHRKAIEKEIREKFGEQVKVY